ncbi:hypothetical protein SAMN05421858_1533 [Haladaptatus litoreus]|uniref:Flagellin N-terminal-like domain-containing protein n=1 Tax=Haladaptatus litoreus TaxID=553468 RepID=A0A1N6YEI5_9EURY|nr:hypothetical protein [Haladaptatus litoreus]SIR12997.1 hypothetical protein SAMN05421858_1533 [Haladaptatus litoreus]
MTKKLFDDRAATELLGFVFIFSMIVASVGLLYVSGVGSLEDARDMEQSKNAERAFTALATTFDDLQRNRAPARAGEVRLGGGTIAVNETTQLRIGVEQTSPTAVEINRTLGQGALVYTVNDRVVRYESGAVFSGGEAGSWVVRRPAFDCTPDRAIVSAVAINETGDISSVSKQGSVLVVGRTMDTELLFPLGGARQDDTAATTVRIRAESSPNSEAWNRYFESNGWEKDGTWYECPTRRAFVRETVVGFDVRN